MKIIRLAKCQTMTARVCNPIFDQLKKIDDDENERLVTEFYRKQTPELRQEIFLSNLHLVRHTVGRYICHWPETKRWEDDIVSVGLMALLEKIDGLEKRRLDHFRAWVVPHIKWRIEEYLNNNRTSVAASLSTNLRRMKQGEPLASKIDVPLTTLGESQ